MGGAADPLPGLGEGSPRWLNPYGPQRGDGPPEGQVDEDFLFVPRLRPAGKGLSGDWGEREGRGCLLLWGAGCSVQPRRPAPPSPRGRREGAPLSTAAADVTCHGPQAGDLGEPVQEVTRWSRGTEGPRAQDAPASGRKRSLLSAAPSVWADWLRSPVAA